MPVSKCEKQKSNSFYKHFLFLKEEETSICHSPENEGEIENVRVVVRVRPMDKSELESGCENIVRVDKLNRCITVLKPNAPVTEPPKIYYFDNVFTEDSAQVRMRFYVLRLHLKTQLPYNFRFKESREIQFYIKICFKLFHGSSNNSS